MNNSLEGNETSSRIAPKGITLRQKVIGAFIALIILMCVGMGITLLRLSDVVVLGSGVINHRQPAVQGYLELIQDTNLATALVNGYLLTAEKTSKEHFEVLESQVRSKFKHLKTIAQSDRNLDATDITALQQAEELFDKFYKYADRLFYLREHDLENYPGLEMAATLLNPYTLEYLGYINELIIDEDYNAPTAEQRHRIGKLLIELRYSWLQMNNAFRLFFNTRSGNALHNFNSYSNVNAEAFSELKAMDDIEVGLNGLDRLAFLRHMRISNTPKIVKVIQDDAWRTDIYIMRTEVYHLVNDLRDILQNLSDKQVTGSIEDGSKLTDTLYKTYYYAGILLFLAVAIALVIVIMIIRGMTPIGTLTHIVDKISFEEPRTIDNTLMVRGDEVGSLARAFSHMITRLSDSYSIIENRNVELLHAMRKAEAANHAKNEFLTNMSHELRTPMHAILSFSEFGKSDFDVSERTELINYFSIIHSSGEQLLGLLNNLLDLSKFESGKMEIDLLECDLRKTVEECIAKEGSMVKKKGLSVEIGTSDCDTKASFDIQKIIQVFVNLLSNAIKFSPEDKNITIEFEDDVIALDQQGDDAICAAIRFSILDEGVGIPED
ncbi:MAG: hypothetical protein KAR30_02470, partial [Gammaproteobacteria bacterium]|nr:hypothetical protein [Gammaproteobacteria bacterium]